MKEFFEKTKGKILIILFMLLVITPLANIVLHYLSIYQYSTGQMTNCNSPAPGGCSYDKEVISWGAYPFIFAQIAGNCGYYCRYNGEACPPKCSYYITSGLKDLFLLNLSINIVASYFLSSVLIPGYKTDRRG